MEHNNEDEKRPTKRAKPMKSLVQEQEEELSRTREALSRAQHENAQNKEALKASLELLFDSDKVILSGVNGWKDLPGILRSHPEVLTHFIAKEREFWTMKREDVSEDTLQQALPGLLANHREHALRACEARFLKWEEVNPTAQEWNQSVALSFMALLRGLVQSRTQVPKLTNEMFTEAIKGEWAILDWNSLPDDLKHDELLSRELLDPETPQQETEETRWGGIWSVLMRLRSEESSVLLFSFGLHGIVAKNVLQTHTSLRQDSQVWEKLIDGLEPSALHSLISHLQDADDGNELNGGIWPPTANLMERAVQKCPRLINLMDQVAHSDRVRGMIEQDANSLVYASLDFIGSFPDFCETTLGEMNPSTLDWHDIVVFADEIPPNWWTNDGIVTTWFELGLPLVSGQPEAWRSDRVKLLFVAQHCAQLEWKRLAFEIASKELRSNARFIRRAMTFEPGLFECASDSLRNENYELAIWALGNHEFSQRCIERVGRYRPILTAEKMEEYWHRGYQEIQQRKAFETFLELVRRPESNHPISTLNLSNGFSGLIRDFVGIPRGKHRRNILKALRNLLQENRARQG